MEKTFTLQLTKPELVALTTSLKSSLGKDDEKAQIKASKKRTANTNRLRIQLPEK
jgi:hypothetical protein